LLGEFAQYIANLLHVLVPLRDPRPLEPSTSVITCRFFRYWRSTRALSGRRDFVPRDHENLNFKGAKLGKSRGAAVDVPYFLTKYDPDPLRIYLTVLALETRDTEACPEGIEGFSWEDFVERNNHLLRANGGNELVAAARLSSRRSLGQPGPTPEKTRVRLRVLGFMLSFAYKRLDGRVPEPGDPSGSSGQGLDDEDRALTYDHSGAIGTWAASELSAGQALRQPAPLFEKLDESLIDEEYARLEG
jgi:hypothetical protein